MQTRTRVLPFVIVLLALVGCAPKVVESTGPRQPTSADQITIYQKEPSKYEVLGMVEVPIGGAIRMDERGDATMAFEELRRKAAALGANGLLLDEKKVPSDVMVTASHKGTFYQVPVNRTPRAAKGQAIFVHK